MAYSKCVGLRGTIGTDAWENEVNGSTPNANLSAPANPLEEYQYGGR